MSDVFVSYASEDRAKAEVLAGALELEGLSVWWDRNILPGEQVAEVIKEEIDRAKCVIVLWSRRSVDKEWVQNEAREGRERHVLVPALIDDVEVPFEFRGTRVANLVDWEAASPHEEFDSLLAAVRKTVKKGVSPVAPTPISDAQKRPDTSRTPPRDKPRDDRPSGLKVSGPPPAEQGRDRYKEKYRSLQLRQYSVAAAIGAAFLVFFLLWVNLFDKFNLDALTESYTIAIGDLFAQKQFHDAIVMVPITENTKVMLHRSKFDRSWRKDYATLIKNLADAGARVIVFDMFFEGESDFDDELARAIIQARAPNRPGGANTLVIVGVRSYEEGKPVLTEELKSAVSGWGALTVGKKVGYARMTPLMIMKGSAPEPVWGLALQAVSAYEGGETPKLESFDVNKPEILVRFGSGGAPVRTLRFFQWQKIEEDQAAPILAKGDFAAHLAIDLTPLSVLRDIRDGSRDSYVDVLNHSEPKSLTQYQGKIVMVGARLENTDFHGGRWGRWGLEYHADAVNTLLNHMVIRPVGPVSQFALMVVLGILAAAIRIRMSIASKRLRLLLLIIVLVTYLAGTIHLYARHRLLLNTVYHAGALFLTYWVVALLKRRYLK